MAKSFFEFDDKFGVGNASSPSFKYESPFKEESIYAAVYEENEAFARIERKLNDLYSNIPSMPPFGAGENIHGSPEKNGFSHGDIEKIALKNIFSEQEIKEVYYGNWLRDYSQFLVGMTVRPDDATIKQFYSNHNLNKQEQKILNHFFNVFTHDNWITILEILATKQFIWKPYFDKDKSNLPYTDGKKYIEEFKQKFPPLTKDTLGIYRPEEHIDNPKDQKDESKLSYINFNYEYDKDKYQKKLKLYKGETAESLFINAGSNSLPDSNTDSNKKFVFYPQGLKYYIFKDIDTDRPSSVTYFMQQLRLSVSYGDTPKGRMHLGAAFHVLEDYFAHTNFVEVCLIKRIDEDVYPWVNFVNETGCQVDEKKDKNFWKDEEKWVVKEPLLGVKNERANCIPIVTGIFLLDDTLASVGPKIADEFFDLAYEPYQLRNSGDRSLFDILMLTTLSAYTKKQKNENEIKNQYDAKLWLDFYNKYLHFRDKIASAENSNDTTKFIFKGIGTIKVFFSYAISFFVNLVLNLIFANSGKTIKEAQSLNYKSNPTHTQIAKDPFDHPLNILAGILAIEAVKDVGGLVKQAIKNKNLSKTVEKNIIEKYFVHPCKTKWMDKIVDKWGLENNEELKKLHFPTIIKEVDYKLNLEKVDMKNFTNYFNSIKELISFSL